MYSGYVIFSYNKYNVMSDGVGKLSLVLFLISIQLCFNKILLKDNIPWEV